MIKYNCLVVEDEPLAVEIMQDYITQVTFLDLKRVCTDAITAIEVLQEEKIDLIFLDIHLPKLKGLDFLRILTITSPKVIITTAYHQYALKSYDFNVVDYLLKPIEFNRFLTAVNKITLLSKDSTTSKPAPRPFSFFNVNKKKVKIFFDEILYIEAQKEYISIQTLSRSIVTKYSLSALEELLPTNEFIRIHRSFIVAKDKIDAYSITDIDIGQKALPIGRNYKEEVQAYFNKLK